MAIRAEETTALILAGGQSRRFGENKARAQVAGQPMITRVFDVLDACFPTVLISTAIPGISFDLPVQHIPDLYPDTGPLGGIHAGFAHAVSPWLFVCAVDLPFITPEAVHQILTACSDAMDGAMATDNNRAQPLFGCYNTKLAAPIDQFLVAGGRSVFRFLETQNIKTVHVPADVLQNINYPEDLPNQSGKFEADG